MIVSARAVTAGLVAAVVSGAPSTAHAFWTRRDPLQATLAAGSLLMPRSARRGALILAAVPVHLALSVGWAQVLARTLPQRRRALWGGAWGAGIAVLDLGAVGRRNPRIRALPLVPQITDHLAFGAVAGALL